MTICKGVNCRTSLLFGYLRYRGILLPSKGTTNFEDISNGVDLVFCISRGESSNQMVFGLSLGLKPECWKPLDAKSRH
jgi:hypothetical protein